MFRYRHSERFGSELGQDQPELAQIRLSLLEGEALDDRAEAERVEHHSVKDGLSAGY